MFKIFSGFFCLFFYQICFAEIRYAFDSYFYAQKNQVVDSLLNPNNQIFKTPGIEYNLDLRGELKWRSESSQLIARPRFTGYQKNIELSNFSEIETKGRGDLTDAFYEQHWNSTLFTTIGLQVYQWGPAEFINATNPLYHFNSRQKSAVYKEKGQVLLRANFSPDRENSFVFIFQPVSNNEQEWIADDAFSAKTILKYEKSWVKSSNYLGFVLGNEEKSNIFIGEYFNYSPIDGFSAYADLKHAQNRINFIPELNGAMINLVLENDLKNQWPTLGVLGLRWEDQYDVRIEFIYNGMGLSKSDLNLAINSAANFVNPLYAQNMQRFIKPGLEVFGQNYLYASYRINEPFKIREFNFYVRYIQSLQDDSSQMQVEFDKEILNSFLIFSNMSLMSGTIDSEFRLINDWQALIGVKWGI